MWLGDSRRYWQRLGQLLIFFLGSWLSNALMRTGKWNSYLNIFKTLSCFKLAFLFLWIPTDWWVTSQLVFIVKTSGQVLRQLMFSLSIKADDFQLLLHHALFIWGASAENVKNSLQNSSFVSPFCAHFLSFLSQSFHLIHFIIGIMYCWWVHYLFPSQIRVRMTGQCTQLRFVHWPVILTLICLGNKYCTINNTLFLNHN